MRELQIGLIGVSEKSEALRILEENHWMNNIWIEIPHTGNHIKGQAFTDIEELLPEDKHIDYFSDLKGYFDFLEDMGMDDDNLILNLLKNGTVYCDFENYTFSNDKDKIVKYIIEDGKCDNYYTYDEALANLKSDSVDDALVVWLIK
jgi:hypothetical protein